MTLRKKTILSITLTTLLLIAVVLLLSNTIILGSFGTLEEQNINQNAQQALRLLDDEIAKLESTLKDWSNWDDTYQFVSDGNALYIENNLNESSIANLNLNFMAFSDLSGHITYGKAVDLGSGSQTEFPAALLDHIRERAVLSRLEDQSVVGGIILLPDFPVLIASAPVLNSLEEGPARGRMIIGRYFDAAVNLITDGRGRPTGYRSIIRDVTEIKHNEGRLVYLAYHDPLTGLYNRKAFMEELEKEIAYASRYEQERVLLFIDLDKFKAVNDTFGHDAGDVLLTMVAQRMRSELRDTDFIARMGGDEFTILLNNPERVPAGIVTRRIKEAIDQPFDIDGRTIDFVSASIGVKNFPRDARTAGDLIKAADGDMYTEKNRNRRPETRDPA